MDKQEIFDSVVKHLVTQGRRAWDKTREFCAYRTPDGLKCAIGHLITDSEYDVEMEYNSVHGLMVKALVKDTSIFNSENYPLLRRLQSIHDRPKNWFSVGLSTSGENQLRELCVQFNLNPTKMEELLNG